jgi:hypothetical protein
MKDSEMLRQIASDLRAEAVKRAEVRRDKAASVLVAATGFGLLGRKLGVPHG